MYFIALTEEDIIEALNQSDFGFSGDDSDEDPEFVPPDFNQTNSNHRNRDSTTVASPTPSADLSDLTLSTSSYVPRSRGRAKTKFRVRGGGRSRGRNKVSHLLSTTISNIKLEFKTLGYTIH